MQTRFYAVPAETLEMIEYLEDKIMGNINDTGHVNELKDTLCLGFKLGLISVSEEDKKELLIRFAAMEVRRLLDEWFSKHPDNKKPFCLSCTNDPLLAPNEIYVHAKFTDLTQTTIDRSGQFSLFTDIYWADKSYLNDTRIPNERKTYEARKDHLAEVMRSMIRKDENTREMFLTQLVKAVSELDPEKIAEHFLEALNGHPDQLDNLDAAFKYAKKKAKADTTGSVKAKELFAQIIDKQFTMSENGKYDVAAIEKWKCSEITRDFYIRLCEPLIAEQREEKQLLAGDPDAVEFHLIVSENNRDIFDRVFDPDGGIADMFLTDVSFTVRADPSKDLLNSPKFRVALRKGAEIYKVNFVTGGILRTNDDAPDRTVELLCDTSIAAIVALFSLNNDALNKKANSALADIFRTSEDKTPIIPIFTGYDELLIRCGRGASGSIWEVTEQADKRCETVCAEIRDMLGRALDANNSKHKPFIAEYGKPIIAGMPNALIIIDPGKTYDGVTKLIFEAAASQLGDKLECLSKSEIGELCSKDNVIFDFHQASAASILKSASTCIPRSLDLFWKTIYSALDKWLVGRVHESRTAVFSNIRTDFVRYLREFADKVYKDLSFITLPAPNIMPFLDRYKYRMGYIFAAKVGEEARDYADDPIHYSYSPNRRFMRMLIEILNLFAEYNECGILPDKVKDLIIDSYLDYTRQIIDERVIVALDR